MTVLLNCVCMSRRSLVTCTVHIKKNATTCKTSAPLFDKKSCRTFMVCTGSTGYGIAALFAKHAAIFAKCMANVPHFHGKRHHNTEKGALQDGALWRGHQSAALLVGEKRRTCHHVFKCHYGTFVAFFLTRTVLS